MHEPAMIRAWAVLALASVAAVCAWPTSTDRQAADPKAVVRGYMEELLNERNWDKWDEYFSETVQFNETNISKDSVMAMSASLRSAFPDMQLSIEDQIAEGDKVATRVVFRGTHQGDFNGIPPTGRLVEYAGIAIDRIVDGKVVQMWHVANSSDIHRQLTN